MKRELVLLIALFGCGDNSESVPDRPPGEAALRTKLGVPTHAKRVIVFGQNAHLDIDWQHTFDDYYTMFVGDLLIAARQLLDDQPRAYYSIAEMAYLQHHLDVHPEELAAVRADSQAGRWRIVGGGMTSPDTLLPETEMLTRDYLYGIQFAEDSLDAHPRAAWLADSFGHGAGAPDLLVAAGYTSVAFSRIDGAPTLTDQVLDRRTTPLPGSTADQLAQIGSADFIWRGSGGAKILAHFLSGTGLYCEGDNIDYSELLEPAGGHIGAYKGTDQAFTDASIDRYIGELEPNAKTPYVFVPVGCDFASPKDKLIEYLDGYNARRAGDSGVYAVVAPFEDYETLVAFHADALPEIDQELSPYYMGFYGSRADLKRLTRDAARPFFVAESYATLLGTAGVAIMRTAGPQLSKLTRSDHHDFVTGTSADLVVTSEQLPLLAETQAAGRAALRQVAEGIAALIPAAPGTTSRALAFNASSAAQDDVVELDVATTNGATPAIHALANGSELPLELIEAPSQIQARFRVEVGVVPFGWQAIDVVPGAARVPAVAVRLALLDDSNLPATGNAITRVVLTNAHVRAEWDRTGGAFGLASLVIDGAEAIAQPSLIVHDYHDDGGLWRLGNEMPGCRLTLLAATTTTETVRVLEQGALRVRIAFVGADATREATLGANEVGLDLAVVTGAAQATTRTVSIALASPVDARLTTSVPGGAVVRPLQHVYTPTFWAAVDFAQVGSWAVLLRQSTGVRMDTPGELELMAARDARQEACDLEGGSGSDSGTHRIEWRIVPAADAVAAAIAAQAFDRPIELSAVTGVGSGLPPSGGLITVDGGLVSAIKPADRGVGNVVRVVALGGMVTIHMSTWLSHATTTAVDLAERNLGALAVRGDDLVFDPAAGSIASVRLQ